MTADWVILPVVWPMLTATLLLVVNSRKWQRGLTVVSLLGLLAIEIVLGLTIAGGTILVHRLGDWPAPFGIILVVDRLAMIMLLLAAVTALAVVLYDIADPDPDLRRLPFYPLFHFLLMGLNGAFVTGDLFNLFVFFEVLLIASYALITLGATARQLRAGFQFVVLNLLTSALFLFGVGALYGLTGTLNMADLAVKVPLVPAGDAVLLHVAMMTLLVVFAAKAALLPLAFWLPDAYPAPPVPVSALFGGIATKVGVYALLRVFTTVFAEVREPAAEVLIFLGATSMILGVLGAVAQTEIRRLLSFHIISQIGYLAFGLALFTVTGVAAAIFYMVHYTIVKCALFLLGGLGERLGGARDLKRLGGLAQRSPMLGLLFFVAAVSLAGLPPTSGFVSKYLVLAAGIGEGRYVAVTIGFVAGLLTLLSMMKIWTMAFWGAEHETKTRPLRSGQLAAAGLLVSFSVTIALLAQPLYELTRATAEQTLDTAAYVAAVAPVSDSVALAPTFGVAAQHWAKSRNALGVGKVLEDSPCSWILQTPKELRDIAPSWRGATTPCSCTAAPS
jgi:multicomponent Na+:H+ antiporter subunit D